MMYDPTNTEAMGPQITARPGTKRHSRQCAARRAFFNIMTSQTQVEIDLLTAGWLLLIPEAGNA